MGVLTRLRRLVQANVHTLLDQAEEPVSTLNCLLEELQGGLEHARTEVATALGAERRLAQRVAEAEESVRQWETRARRAVAHGEDGMAREALRRLLAARDMTEQTRLAHAQQQEMVTQLRVALQQLEQRLEDVRARRSILLARLDVVRAQQAVARSLRRSATGGETGETMQRITEQLASAHHQAVALVEIAQDPTDAFRVAEEHSAVEHALAEMKRELTYTPDDAPKAALQPPEEQE